MRLALTLAALMVASPAVAGEDREDCAGACLPRASAGPLVVVQSEGGGIGGSLVVPEAGTARPQPRPRRAAPQMIVKPEETAEARYSFPINTAPDGWAALKAEPWGGSKRLTKVYDGTRFLVVGAVPGWKLVQFKSGERGWIVERLVGCCRPASQ